MLDKQQYLAYYIRVKIPMSFDAMTTSPVESMNSHIKDRMGVTHNADTSTSLLKLAKGGSKLISSFTKDAQWQLQVSSLASKLEIKDTLIRESLYICNQNFDRRMTLHCVQTSKDKWIMWFFPKRKCAKKLMVSNLKYLSSVMYFGLACAHFLMTFYLSEVTVAFTRGAASHVNMFFS